MISNSLFVFLGEFLGKLLTKARNLSGVPTIKILLFKWRGIYWCDIRDKLGKKDAKLIVENAEIKEKEVMKTFNDLLQSLSSLA